MRDAPHQPSPSLRPTDIFSGHGQEFQILQVVHGLSPRRMAHGFRRSQARAEGRAFGFTEQGAAVVRQKLHAGNPRRLAVWHAGDRRGDRRRDTTRATVRTTVHEMT